MSGLLDDVERLARAGVPRPVRAEALAAMAADHSAPLAALAVRQPTYAAA